MPLLRANRQAHEVGKHFTIVQKTGYERQQTSKSETAVLMFKSPHVRKPGFQNPGKFLAWNTESGKNIACGIWNPGLWNPV